MKISIPLWCNFGGQLPEDGETIQDFNSTMVQFWAKLSRRLIPVPRFQFHYGAILGPDFSGVKYSGVTDFNSTMVQFWEKMAIDIILAHLYFNSTMVQFWVWIEAGVTTRL